MVFSNLLEINGKYISRYYNCRASEKMGELEYELQDVPRL